MLIASDDAFRYLRSITADHVDNADTQPTTVLVVDDEREVRSLVRRLLESEGFAVLEAADGNEALRIAARLSGAIQVLLTDVLMPGLSGPELAAQLQVRDPSIGAIFMSGYQGATALGEALRRTRASFVQKPFSRTALLTAVRAAVVSQ